jgi:glycosyltransferase involved in cell wall biosynthesis
MADGKPLVSIGMPIYNEGPYLRKALDSLLGQEYQHIEIIITDNASQDDTESICREYAARDGRVRFVRNETNVGAIENFNLAFRLSTGDYFMWASGHDLRTAGSISKCVEVMERDRGVVLCYPEIVHIDRDGNVTEAFSDFQTTFHRPADKVGRLMCFLFSDCSADIIYGLLRRGAVRDIVHLQPVYAGDCVVLIRLSLAGSFAQVRGEFLYIRNQRGVGETEDDRIKRYQKSWFPGGTPPRRWFPFWGLVRGCLASVSRERVPLGRKVALYVGLLLWLSRTRPFLLRELVRGGWPRPAAAAPTGTRASRPATGDQALNGTAPDPQRVPTPARRGWRRHARRLIQFLLPRGGCAGG